MSTETDVLAEYIRSVRGQVPQRTFSAHQRPAWAAFAQAMGDLCKA